MAKVLALICVAVAMCAVVANANGTGDFTRPAFERWMNAHGKTYETEELYERRFASWLANAKFVEHHRKHNHNATYTVGLNQFADLNGPEWREWVSAQGLRRASRPNYKHMATPHTRARAAAPPTSVDWRAMAGPIWNQQQCGSSPYFGAVDPVTVLWAQQTGMIIPLSMQQCVDCSSAEGNYGCGGGEMTYTYQYIIDNKGICSAQEYPYTGVDGASCLAANCTNVARISAFKSIGNDETALLAVVATIPVATAVDAACQSFQLYTSGIVNDPTCAGTNAQPDHGISIFGYGTDKGVNYWTLRNSWGATWGEAGYIRLARGVDQAGLADNLVYPMLTL